MSGRGIFGGRARPLKADGYSVAGGGCLRPLMMADRHSEAGGGQARPLKANGYLVAGGGRLRLLMMAVGLWGQWGPFGAVVQGWAEVGGDD